MSFRDLFQGTSRERFIACPFGFLPILLKYVDPKNKKAQNYKGEIIDISGKNFYELHITTERPKFEKGEQVLALIPFLNGNYLKLFTQVVVQSSFISEDKRKMYELQKNDGKIINVHEEFVIPTQDKWKSKENNEGDKIEK